MRFVHSLPHFKNQKYTQVLQNEEMKDIYNRLGGHGLQVMFYISHISRTL
jgi:hypothetical protein